MHSYTKLLSLFLLLLSQTLLAQNREFAPIGAEWKYTWVGMIHDGDEIIRVEKDTVLNGSKAKKLNIITYLFPRYTGGGLKKDTLRKTRYLKITNDSVFIQDISSTLAL
jgi:hypothetical protein